MAWFHRQAKEPLRPDLKQRWEARLRNDPKEQAKFMDDLSKDIQRMVSKRRICCLTRDPTSTLMWSHYAENHHGHCCPVRSPIDSTGCRGRVSRCRSRRPEVPVKWAFSRRA